LPFVQMAAFILILAWTVGLNLKMKNEKWKRYCNIGCIPTPGFWAKITNFIYKLIFTANPTSRCNTFGCENLPKTACQTRRIYSRGRCATYWIKKLIIKNRIAETRVK
jgi:hypothetical protein